MIAFIEKTPTWRRLAGSVSLALLLAGSPARAQVGATIQGVARDAGGGVLSGVLVEVRNERTNAARRVVTSDSGVYRLAGLDPAGRYRLRATLDGFDPFEVEISDLAAGVERVVDIALAVSGVSEEVQVSAERALALSVAPALGGTLAADQVDRVPTNGRDLLGLAYLVAGAAPARGFYNLAPRLTINGASSLVTNYTVDGFDNTDLFLGGPKVPVTIGAAQNVSVLANSYSVEYGRTGNGVFAVTTRSGGNRRAGDVFYTVRPGSVLDAPNFFAPRDAQGHVIDDSFERHQLGGSFGGLILEDRTFYFVNAEITRERQDAILTSPLSVGLAPTRFDQQSVTAKVDHQWRPTEISTFRYLFTDYTHDNDVGFVGGLTLPSAGLQVSYRSQFASWNHRSILGTGLLETGILAGRLRANWHTADTGPRVIVTDGAEPVAIVGGVSDDFFWTETDLQIRSLYSWEAGRHTLKVGGDLLRGAFDIRPGPGARGAYAVDLEGRTVTPSGPYLTREDLPADVAVLSYSQSFVNPRVTAAQTLATLFAEDQFRPHADLTVSAGVRWDYDSATDTPVGSPDLNNLGPRLGATWRPRGSERDTVRAGVGLFFERIPFAVYSDTIFNNPDGGALSVTFAPGTAFAPPVFPNAYPRDHFQDVPLDQLPPRNVQVFDPALRSPRTRQISIGYQRELPGGISVAVDYIDARGVHLIRRIDTNAPASVLAGTDRPVAAADATRPIVPVAGGLRLIEADQSSGHSRFRGVYVTARKRVSHGVAFDVAYTISKAENDTDDINFRPVNSRNPDAEWGPSLNDRRHVLAVNGWIQLPWRIELVPVFFVSSGQPLNVTTGRDDNGDTIFNDRPAGFARNGERTSGFTQLDLSIARPVALGRARLDLRAEVFNVLNTTNFSGFFNFGASGVRPDENGTLAFQPTVAGPARQIQLSARVRF